MIGNERDIKLDYKIIETIGKGNLSKVLKAKHRLTNEYHAVKMYKK
jgi:serine/threonine protein kinase